MKTRLFSCLITMIVFSICASTCTASMVYTLRTETTNGDNAMLVSGFFKTDGTTGTNLALGSILQDWSIEIAENGGSFTLTSANSSIANDAAFFDVTNDKITLTNGSEFNGLRINANSDSNIRYAAFRTTNTTNVFVSLNSGTGGLTGGANDFVVATPEPTSLMLFSVVALAGLYRRRR